MCLVAFAINVSARWPLLIASNRDEFFDRPALPMARWQTSAGHTIISGRDVLAGGTWLGMTPGGRIALLTNVRQIDAAPARLSRGHLVMRWLENEMDAALFMTQTDSGDYGGFNLVVGDFQSNSWTWLSNRSFNSDLINPEVDQSAHVPLNNGWCSRALSPGIYGLSNASLDTPWPKTLLLKSVLTEALGQIPEETDGAQLEQSLWAALANRSRASPGDLPHTGLPVAREQALSSVFVEEPARRYGTRCSTLLVASAAENLPQRGWNLRVTEKTHALHEANPAVIKNATYAISHDLQWRETSGSA